MLRAVFLVIFLFSFQCFALCVKTATTNLRSGPGAKYAITWVAPKYTPLVEISRSGGWIQVGDLEGEQHWVSAQNVTSKIVCVAVRVPLAKVRKGPSAQAEAADIVQVDKHTSFKRLDVQGDYAEVEASWGEVYWIKEDVLWRPVKLQKISF